MWITFVPIVLVMAEPSIVTKPARVASGVMVVPLIAQLVLRIRVCVAVPPTSTMAVLIVRPSGLMTRMLCGFVPL